MRKSIFEIENRLDILKEYERIKKALFDPNSLIYNAYYSSLFEFLDEYVFPNWKYRDTFVDIDDYLNNLDIDFRYTFIQEENFLYLLEFLLNIWNTAKTLIDLKNVSVVKKISFDIIDHNIPIILERMNYTFVKDNDKLIITKRNSDVDSILDIVPIDIATLLLSYNDIKNNNLDSKSKILKSLDLYIETDKKKYKSYDSSLYDSIQTIVNEMGVNHPLHEKYKSLSKEELCSWYDKCFKMMIHLIRQEDIIQIKKERKELLLQEE